MKHIKTYENIKNEPEPQIGDYVICNEKLTLHKLYENFISNTIGKFIEINNGQYNFNTKYKYIILYKNIPKKIKQLYSFQTVFLRIKKNNYIRPMQKEEIIHFSPDKEELKTMIAAKKYNL